MSDTPEALGACGVVARVFGADQENPAPSLVLAASRSEPLLPSLLLWIVLAEVGAPGARPRDDLRRNACRKWAGCWAGMGGTRAGRLGTARTRTHQKRLARLLRAGYAGAGAAFTSSPAETLGE